MLCDYSISQYLEDLLLATDSEQTTTNASEEEFLFEIPNFVTEQAVL